MSESTPIREIKLPDGTQAYILNPEQLSALNEIIEDRLWWAQTKKRARRVSVLAGFGIAILMGLASWWPWITRWMQLILQDVPK